MSAYDAASSTRSSLSRYSVIRGPLDKWLFLIVFVIGATLIITLKVVFGLDQIGVIFFPIGLMLGYLLLVRLVPRYRLREDQVGDNLYYLGFLYTLTSLAVALYYFTDGIHALDHIVTNFGIALATTILGVALRVVMHQMREDPLDTEREARETLAEASSRLRAELDDSVRSLSTFSTQVEQIVEETLHELTNKAGNALSESTTKVATASNDASEGIAEAFRAYNEQVKQLSATSKKQISAIEALTAKLDAVEVPSDLIEEKLSQPVTKLLMLVEQSLEHQKIEEARREELAESIRLMGLAAQEVKTHSTTVSDTLDGITSHATALGSIVEKLEWIPEKLSGAAEANHGLAKVQEELASAQTEVLEQQKERLLSLHSDIETEAQGLLRKITKEQVAMLEQLMEQARQNLSDIGEIRKETQQEARQAQEATRDVLQQLASMVRALGDELGASSKQPEGASSRTGTDG